jgi:hypothetical protein
VECEKFESLLIDELYGELDEVTSAAVKRHAAGCARCGALLSGFRATRKVASLPVEQPSSDLEDRILSAVREQQKVLPFRARMSTVLSRAGAWAMRPQTAMAAVFLLVIGTSFVLVQSRSKHAAPSLMGGSAEGTPVAAAAAPTAMASSAYALDGKEAAFAHGLAEQPQTRRATAIPSTEAQDESKDKRDETSLATATLGKEEAEKNNLPTNAGAIAGATDDLTRRMQQAQGGGGAAGPMATAPSAQTQAPYGGGGVSFGSAKLLYDARRYDEAKAQWDVLAPTDANAALWAARAERAKAGCTDAVIQRYEQVRTRAGNTAPGNEATLDVGRCYRSGGQASLARSRFSSLLPTQFYGPAAQQELDQMTPSAAHKAMPAPRSIVTGTAAATTTPQAQPTQKAASDSTY